MAREPRRPPTRILLVRHGQTVSNKEGRFCGHSETALTPLGIEQARALGRRLASLPLDAVYTSDFSRSIDTAAIILAGRDLTPRVDAGFREIHYGDWEMERERDIARRDRETMRLLRAEDPSWRPPGGETIDEVRRRTLAALDRVIRAHPHQSALIVTHGTAINCLLAGILRMDPAFTFRITIANCALNELVVYNRRVLVTCLNDRSHLQGIESPS